MKRLLFPLVVLAIVASSAVLTQTGTEAAGPVGNFSVVCGWSHALNDDPIVFPGQPGASHLHEFVGNRTTNAYSTPESLLGQPTTCSTPSDRAAYWVPALYANGVRKKPASAVFYYSSHPVQETAEQVVAFPQGMEIIGGFSKATGPVSKQYAFWQCGNGGSSYDHPPAGCRSVELDVIFPFCWSGTGNEVVYPVLGSRACPADHPIQLPKLRLRNTYNVGAWTMITFAGLGPNGEYVTDAPYYTAHADFVNVWDQARLEQLVHDCIVARVVCGRIRT